MANDEELCAVASALETQPAGNEAMTDTAVVPPSSAAMATMEMDPEKASMSRGSMHILARHSLDSSQQGGVVLRVKGASVRTVNRSVVSANISM